MIFQCVKELIDFTSLNEIDRMRVYYNREQIMREMDVII